MDERAAEAISLVEAAVVAEGGMVVVSQVPMRLVHRRRARQMVPKKKRRGCPPWKRLEPGSKRNRHLQLIRRISSKVRCFKIQHANSKDNYFLSISIIK